jgi:NhaB family Na+:H+ antiporter
VFRDTAIAATAEDDADVALLAAFAQNFMGHSPLPYKIYVVTAMLLNVGIRYGFGKPAAAWAVLVEFIITLAMAPYCYPLQPGGLIVIEGFLLGLATPKTFQHEVEMNLNVLLLVAFMVTCIHFLKNLLLWVFTNILVKIESKVLLSVAMMLVSAVLAAFLDALSVAAVIASVCSGVLGVYYHVVENADLPLVECLHHETMSYELVPHAPSRAARHLTEEQVRDILVEHPVHHEDQGSAAFSATAPDSGIHKVVNPIGHSSPASPAQSPSPDSNREAMARTASTGGPAPTSPASAKPIELAQAYGLHKEDILQFRNFLKSLLMHGAMGTALGACSTLVGGPQVCAASHKLRPPFASLGLLTDAVRCCGCGIARAESGDRATAGLGLRHVLDQDAAGAARGLSVPSNTVSPSDHSVITSDHRRITSDPRVTSLPSQ